MSQPIVIVGGGPAGIFAAIQCAELCPDNEVVVLEKSSECLSKVKVSGGGRCNVTHNELEPKGMALQYPRGGQALIGPFRVFGVQQTVEWFRQRGVLLKTEADGRMFPDTDDSSTIVNCLLQASSKAGSRSNAIVR
jgi:predicted flavoprotein YhiN